jgi:hypothetical protein
MAKELNLRSSKNNFMPFVKSLFMLSLQLNLSPSPSYMAKGLPSSVEASELQPPFIPG